MRTSIRSERGSLDVNPTIELPTRRKTPRARAWRRIAPEKNKATIAPEPNAE